MDPPKSLDTRGGLQSRRCKSCKHVVRVWSLGGLLFRVQGSVVHRAYYNEILGFRLVCG